MTAKDAAVRPTSRMADTADDPRQQPTDPQDVLELTEFFQNRKRLFFTVMTPRQVGGMMDIPVYNPSKKDGYQRDPDERRARAAARHLLKGGIFPGALIASLRADGASRLIVVSESRTPPRKFRVMLPPGLKLWLVDGQHRRAALQIVTEDNPANFSPANFGVPVIIMCMDSEVEEALQFQTIHDQQKNVATDLTNRILQREVEDKEGDPRTLIQTGQIGKYKDYVAIKVTEALAEHNDSPWFGYVKPVNPLQLQRGDGEETHWPVTEHSMTTSLMPFIRYMNTAPANVSAEIAKRFWRAVRQRCSKAWDDPEVYPYLRKTPGIYIMHEILPTLHRQALMEGTPAGEADFERLLAKAGVGNEFWHRDGPLQGIGGVGGYRMKAADLETALYGA